MRSLLRPAVPTTIGLLAVAAAVWVAVDRSDRVATEGERVVQAAVKRRQPRSADERVVSDEIRQDALRRARAWKAPSEPIRDRFRVAHIEEMSCRFLVTRVGGTTPKFDCALDNGDRIRVKYGKGSEIHSEAAATQLVRALGFGADTITLVERLRCYGCPPDPYATLKAVGVTHVGPIYAQAVNYGQRHDYEWVAVERKYDGQPIETAGVQGWSFQELDLVDPSRGGAPRAHVDALRLLAAFLAHWDNKSDNQRLVCVSREWPDGAYCPEPVLLLQDLGAAFGPRKVDLDGWASTGIWTDRLACRLTMKGLPYGGGTFAEPQVSEEGRQLLAKLLGQVSDAQAAALFSGARFDQKRGLFSDVQPVEHWVRAFKTRVAMISDGPPCPAR